MLKMRIIDVNQDCGNYHILLLEPLEYAFDAAKRSSGSIAM